MKQTVIYEVSEILDTFNLEEITKLLQNQIYSSEDYGTKVDHFKPLYYKYQSIINTEGNSDEIKNTAITKFMDVCNIFLSLICKKFHLEIDQSWKDDHYNDLPGFAMALYSFFVLDISSNIYDVCVNYINKNTQFIYEAFEDRKSKKDAATLVNKKILSPELAIIVSNIYDISTWILSQLTEEQFIQYLNTDYIPLKFIIGILENGILSGEFMIEINDIYSSNIGLKSDVCFQLISHIQNTNNNN